MMIDAMVLMLLLIVPIAFDLIYWNALSDHLRSLLCLNPCKAYQ